MNRCLIALLTIVVLAAPARTGTDRGAHNVPGAKSAAGQSSAASNRLTTSLGRTLAKCVFIVPKDVSSKDNPIEQGASMTGAGRILRTAFDAVYPNPANPTASIRYALAEPAHVRLAIYAVNGELVRVLVNDRRGAGEYLQQWDGRNERGENVSSGIYFARLEAGSRLFTRKLIIAR